MAFMKANGDGSGDLADLAVFVAVAEAQGVSAAARRLGASKAMVSTALARLEARLGVRLLQRSTRRVSLTGAGAAALPAAQRALAAAREAEEAAVASRSAPRGTLRVNAPMSFGLLHVMPAIGAFVREFPEIRVDLQLDDRLVDNVAGAFDVALRIGNLRDSALVSTRLATSRNVVVASPAYLRAAGAPRTPADLAAHAVLAYSLAPAPSRWILRRGGRAEEVRVRPAIEANSSLALRAAALDGLGVARVPLFAVSEELAAGRLLRVLPEWELPDHGVHAVTTSRDLPQRTRLFVERFRERLGRPPYWERGTV